MHDRTLRRGGTRSRSLPALLALLLTSVLLNPVVATATAATASATSAEPSSALAAIWPPRSYGPFHIRSTANGRCLDEPYGSPYGTRLQLWDCYGAASLNQQWWIREGVHGYFEIYSNLTGRCVDSGPGLGSNGRLLTTLNCSSIYEDRINYNQLWGIRTWENRPPGSIGAALGSAIIDADYHSLCCNGTYVQLWTDYGSSNQLWTFDTDF